MLPMDSLYFMGVNGNTDDSNFVIICPWECGRPKTWFSYDKLDRIVDSIVGRVVARMQSNNRGHRNLTKILK